MIFNYKICKYNYKINYQSEWSSIWDFSSSFSHSNSLPSEYLDMEKTYLNVAIEFLKLFHGDDLLIEAIEVNRNADDTGTYFQSIETNLLGSMDKDLYKLTGTSVTFIDAIYLLQLSLREIIWIKFLHSSGAYIAFGHDYYWLVGIDDKINPKSLVNDQALFIYEHSNPWD